MHHICSYKSSLPLCSLSLSLSLSLWSTSVLHVLVGCTHTPLLLSLISPFCLSSILHAFCFTTALPTLVQHAVVERPAPQETVTASFGRFISGLEAEHLTPTVLQRSKRMVLDSLGVGLLGSTTEVFELALEHCQVRSFNNVALHRRGEMHNLMTNRRIKCHQRELILCDCTTLA